MNQQGTGPAQGFWDLLTDAERAALSALGRTTVFAAGATMCVEGDPATHVFILMAGWVKILGVTSDGHEMVLALRGPGDIVGEMAGEATGYRTATVQAIDTVRSLIVRKGLSRLTPRTDATPWPSARSSSSSALRVKAASASARRPRPLAWHSR